MTNTDNSEYRENFIVKISWNKSDGTIGSANIGYTHDRSIADYAIDYWKNRAYIYIISKDLFIPSKAYTLEFYNSIYDGFNNANEATPFFKKSLHY